MTDKIKKALAALMAVGALSVGGAAIAGAAGTDSPTPNPTPSAVGTESVESESENDSDENETDVAISGSDLDKASAAALADTPGQVTETEVGDEESYYEVEVTKADGGQVDVQLDRSFAVVGSEADGQDG